MIGLKSSVLLFILICETAFAIPSPPTEPGHPGVPKRGTFQTYEVSEIRRGSTLFLPSSSSTNIPLVVFSHGQALNLEHYKILFEHLAKQGIAVFYPKYDKGFFDTDWKRMGQDYNRLTEFVLKNFPRIDRNKIVYSGHSKGGYVALMALGLLSNSHKVKAGLLFSPAGFDSEVLTQMDKEIKMSVVYPEDDSIIKLDLIEDIMVSLPVSEKQLIKVPGHLDQMPGHFMPLTKKSLFGGRDGIGPYHYFGIIPWIHGALFENGFLYGSRAMESGDPLRPHLIQKY